MALLDGLLHCYSPSLGPTGYRLIDRGPRRIHGVGDGVAATSWAGSALQKWSLNFGGAASFSLCGGMSVSSRRTISAWFRTTQVYTSGSVAYQVLVEGGVRTTNQLFMIGMGTGTTVSQPAGSTYLFVTQAGSSISSIGYNDGRWYHIVARHNGNSYDMIVNGAIVASGTMTTTPSGTVSEIGAQIDQQNKWTGGIGEIAYWSRDLTQSEAVEIYRSGDGAIGRMLTGQSSRKSRLSQSMAAGGATPWLYARRRSQVIGSGGVH